jgi:hypothetical protein
MPVPRCSLPVLSAVCATWLAAGCGTAASTHLAAVSPCHLSQFAVTLGPYVSEATGQHTLPLRLENRGSVTCVLDGYPRVALYDANGVIPFVVKRGGDQMISSDPPKPFKIPPDGRAFVVINKYRCDRGPLRGTRQVRISSDRQASGSASITFEDPHNVPTAYRIPDYCGRRDPGSTLTVSPFVGTLRAALGG